MTTLFSKIAHWVHGAAVKVSDVFVKVFGKTASEHFAQGALAILKTDAGKIVLDAVEAVSTLADPAAKHAAAFEKVAADFKSKGYEASESILNLLIELAVAQLKGNIGAL